MEEILYTHIMINLEFQCTCAHAHTHPLLVNIHSNTHRKVYTHPYRVEHTLSIQAHTLTVFRIFS